MRQADPPLQEGYRWDVAMSLLAQDEPFAARLKDELVNHVRGEIFLYSRHQEAIAQEGELVALFKRVFRSEARFVIVIHRSGWGDSRYTAIEQDALRARYLNEGPRRILIVSVDGTYPASWYPEDHFRPSSLQFSTAQIAAIVVGRLQEVGGSIGPEDPVEKAHRLRLERAKRERLANEIHHLGPGLIESESRVLFNHLNDFATRITAGSDERMSFDERSRKCQVNYRSKSLVFQWHRQFSNSMDGVQLAMSIVAAPTEFAGRRSSEPRVLLSARFDIDHPEEDVWGWHPSERLPRLADHVSTQELARWAISTFLDMTGG